MRGTDPIRLQAITRSYPLPNGSEPIEILRELELTVEAGEQVLVTGENGSGKSTLLRIVGCLDEDFIGTYDFFGDRLVGGSSGLRKKMSQLRGRRIGFLHQRIRLMPHLSLLHNMMLVFAFTEVPASDRKRRALAMLRKVSLGPEYDGRKPRELSGGQRQLAAMARVLLGPPDLLLVDEPTASLDPGRTKRILALIDETVTRHQDRMRCIIVSHRADLVKKSVSRHLRLENGVLWS